MSTAPTQADDAAPAAAGGVADYYLGLCLSALVVVAWEVSQLRASSASAIAALPFVLGLALLWFRWAVGPPAFLLVLAVVVIRQGGRDEGFLAFGGSQAQTAVLVHRLILCAAAAAFVVAFYRRLAMESAILPPDRRKVQARPGEKPARLPPVRREAAQATVSEFFALLVIVPACCLAAYMLWQLPGRVPLPQSLGNDVATGEWRVLVLLVGLALAAVAGQTLYGYLERTLATPMQSLLYLQDQLWLETRREQGRANRLLFAARLRAQRRKERT